jgi:integrase
MLLVAAWTGTRRGEVLALRWSDIVDGEIRAERSVWHRHERSTKTDDPRRVTVGEPLAEVFAEQRKWLLRTQHPGLASELVRDTPDQNLGSHTKLRGPAARRYLVDISSDSG